MTPEGVGRARNPSLNRKQATKSFYFSVVQGQVAQGRALSFERISAVVLLERPAYAGSKSPGAKLLFRQIIISSYCGSSALAVGWSFPLKRGCLLPMGAAYRHWPASRLTCHICVGESSFSNPGIPVMRIPPATFQYVSSGGSSVTPFPSISLGGLGNIPCAIAVRGCPGQAVTDGAVVFVNLGPATNAASSAGMGEDFGISLRMPRMQRHTRQHLFKRHGGRRRRYRGASRREIHINARPESRLILRSHQPETCPFTFSSKFSWTLIVSQTYKFESLKHWNIGTSSRCPQLGNFARFIAIARNIASHLKSVSSLATNLSEIRTMQQRCHAMAAIVRLAE